MSDETMELTPQEEKARDAVRALPEVPADPAFRARLSREFATGLILDRPPLVRPPRPRWKTAVRWGYIPAAAAILVVMLLIQNRGPDWILIQSSKHGTAVVDGHVFDLGVKGQALDAFRPRADVALTGDAEITLLSPGVLAMQVAPGTAFHVPNPPGRWFGKTMRASLGQGELRFMTGPDFPGDRLIVKTPEGEAEVTGTAISVWRQGTTTCVCVLKGTAMIGTDAEDMQPVPAGKRKVMFGDDKKPEVLDIAPEHRDGMIPFVKRVEPYLEED